MSEIGKYLIYVGLALALVGVVLWLGGGRLGLGKLPGDVVINRGSTTFYFPIVTCLLLSLLLSAVLWLLRR